MMEFSTIIVCEVKDGMISRWKMEKDEASIGHINTAATITAAAIFHAKSKGRGSFASAQLFYYIFFFPIRQYVVLNIEFFGTFNFKYVR